MFIRSTRDHRCRGRTDNPVRRPLRDGQDCPSYAGRILAASRRWIGRLHDCQEGTISILSVFATLVLVMLLGMVMNSGRQVDGKIRVQNAADSAAYSGSLVIARGMNDLAFTNHLLCDIFAMTAFMREARDRNAEQFVPDILAAWSNVGPKFMGSGFPKFEALGPAILGKVPLEQELVRAYSEWGSAASERILPLLEQILAEEMIPQYQQAVVATFPDIAQLAAAEVALRDCFPHRGRCHMLGVLWRTNGTIVGGDGEASSPTLPAVDPLSDAASGGRYFRTARDQRKRIAHMYLGHWNAEAMYFFDREAKMGQFGALWQSFTCGQLDKLLEDEYPRSNLPMVIRESGDDVTDPNAHLADQYTFIGVSYWHRLPEMFPKLFRNPMENDAIGFAEARVFVPKSRLVWHHWVPGGGGDNPMGGVPGEFIDIPPEPNGPPTATPGEGRWVVGRQGVPEHWDLFNQHWTAQIVPATQPSLIQILQTPPPVPEFAVQQYQLPSLGGIGPEDLARINTH